MPLPTGAGGRNHAYQLGNSVSGSYGREAMKMMKKEAEFVGLIEPFSRLESDEHAS